MSVDAAATTPAQTTEPISSPAPPPADEGIKVYAGNLSYKSTSEDLKNLFTPVGGEILSCEVVFRGKRSSGYGFVAYKTTEEAEKAVSALNTTEVDGRPIQVEIARPPQPKERKPRVRKPRTASTPAAAGRAPRAEDAVDGEEEGDEVKPKKKAPRKRNKKVAAPAAEGEAAETSDAAAAAAPKAKAPRKKAAPATRIDDETGEVVPVTKAPKAPRAPREPPTGEPSETLVFVASLPFTMDDDALKALFADAGVNVTSSRIVKRPFGVRRSKGFGFVDTANADEQKKALALDGRELEGRNIAVKVALQHQRDPAESLEQATATEETPAPATE